MSFVARLRPELISIAPPWHTFHDTIGGLVAALRAADLVPPGAETAALQAVTAREREASTVLLDIHSGVPHARLPGIASPAVALAVSTQGLYEAVPTVPIQIVALVLSPPDAGIHHLNILSNIATLLRSAELRAELLAARDAAEALASLRRYGRAVPA